MFSVISSPSACILSSGGISLTIIFGSDWLELSFVEKYAFWSKNDDRASVSASIRSSAVSESLNSALKNIVPS